ncbi:MAG: OmpA family protein [Planctomycetota bacterium]|nr:OmpA family protein [Planctomycetota bacterium]
MSDAAPKIKIVYKKRKSEGHGHHGGAWKVAFADFMTAMMALFLVLWIMAQSQEVKSAVAYYFRHPSDYEGKPDSLLRGNQGLMDVKNGRLDTRPSLNEEGKSFSPPQGNQGLDPQSVAGGASNLNPEPGLRPEPVERIEEDPDEVRDFLKLADLLWQQLGLDPSYMRFKDQVTIETMEDGLLVQLVETPDAPLLEDHTFNFTPSIKRALAVLGKKLKAYPNKIEIDGHGTGLGKDPADKWVGSAMLADLARAELQANGIRPSQISRIAGCADTRPLNKEPRAINRRISIMVHPKQWRPDRY